jgi:uncharacterized Zn-binding protein involved in type VI secretion
MPGVVRLGDAHACGSIATGASPNVLANGIRVHRLGDADNVLCHTATQAEGSPNVLANGIPIARCGDNHGGDLCPHPPNPHTGCSANVLANG